MKEGEIDMSAVSWGFRTSKTSLPRPLPVRIIMRFTKTRGSRSSRVGRGHVVWIFVLVDRTADHGTWGI